MVGFTAPKPVILVLWALGRHRSAILGVTAHFHLLRTFLFSTDNDDITLALALANLTHKTCARHQSDCQSIYWTLVCLFTITITIIKQY